MRSARQVSRAPQGEIGPEGPLGLREELRPGRSGRPKQRERVHVIDAEWIIKGNGGVPTIMAKGTDYCAGDDSRLSNAREWTATVTQAEAEGTATTRRAWTAQRVFQSVAAGTRAPQNRSSTGLHC
ncbi:MAG: hypothetical protein MZV65_31760 [Chromatiales bacterium]|nr:hypothetical protein [Chromatiales bacterium]